MSGRKRIPTGSADGLGQSPFDRLSSTGLPAGTAPAAPADPGPARSKRGRVDVVREKAGRGGKTATVLRGFAPQTTRDRDLEELLREFKKACACGGALKGREVVLQGDVRDTVIPLLEQRGYRPVRAGG